jgi:hypothetical protein
VSAVRSWWLACSEKRRSARSSSSTRCALRSSDDAIASISGTPLREPGQRVREPLALDQCEPDGGAERGDAEEDEGEQGALHARVDRVGRRRDPHDRVVGPGRGGRHGVADPASVLDDFAAVVLDHDPVPCGHKPVERVGRRLGCGAAQLACYPGRLALDPRLRVRVYGAVEDDAERNAEQHEDRDDDRERRREQPSAHVIPFRSGTRRRARS